MRWLFCGRFLKMGTIDLGLWYFIRLSESKKDELRQIHRWKIRISADRWNVFGVDQISSHRRTILGKIKISHGWDTGPKFLGLIQRSFCCSVSWLPNSPAVVAIGMSKSTSFLDFISREFLFIFRKPSMVKSCDFVDFVLWFIRCTAQVNSCAEWWRVSSYCRKSRFFADLDWQTGDNSKEARGIMKHAKYRGWVGCLSIND